MLPWPRHARPNTLISKSNFLSLDLLSGLAAPTVFLHHRNSLGLDGGVFAWLRKDVQHSAVVIFFVLSGRVMSAILPRNGSALDYFDKTTFTTLKLNSHTGSLGRDRFAAWRAE